MKLPENKKRENDAISKKKLWIYGSCFIGKSTFADKFPDAIFLNTDGNVNNITSQYIAIKNYAKVEGRMTQRIKAWDVFRETILELEKKQNTYKTIVVDLLEDCYEHCRLFCYEKLGIEHESDNALRAYDFVRSEFLNTIRCLVNLDYENIILISQEDSSRDITKRSGEKFSTIKPAIADKVALKIAGMVDLVARITNDGEKRCLNFRHNEYIFGGGRLSLPSYEIPLTYEALNSLYTAKKG
jgi:phage nucleotide-binding protein